MSLAQLWKAYPEAEAIGYTKFTRPLQLFVLFCLLMFQRTLIPTQSKMGVLLPSFESFMLIATFTALPPSSVSECVSVSDGLFKIKYRIYL